jgi:hypothetical protein
VEHHRAQDNSRRALQSPVGDSQPGDNPCGDVRCRQRDHARATPRFPDYIAGHTTYAGAAQKVLEHLFGKRPGAVITLTSITAPGVVENYTTFKDIADDVVDARVWGGIHWRTSSVRGRSVGEEIGRYTVRHFLRLRNGDDARDDRPRR